MTSHRREFLLHRLLIELEKLNWIAVLRWNTYKSEKYITNLKMNKTEAEAVMKYLQKKCMILKEIHQVFDTVPMKWVVEFKWVRDSTENDPLPSHPKNSTTNEKVDAIYYIILDDKCLTVWQIAKSVGLSSGSVDTVLTEILGMSKLSARCVPRILTV